MAAGAVSRWDLDVLGELVFCNFGRGVRCPIRSRGPRISLMLVQAGGWRLNRWQMQVEMDPTVVRATGVCSMPLDGILSVSWLDDKITIRNRNTGGDFAHLELRK